jgi:hypothetical protein
VCLENITNSGDDLPLDEINADIEEDIDKNEVASDDGVPGAKKRSFRSARVVALGKALSNNRMEVAVKSAAMRESSMLKVAKLQNAAKTVLTDRQMKVQLEGIAAMKTCQLLKIQGNQVVELMKAFVAAGQPPAEAWRLANEAESASDRAEATGNVAGRKGQAHHSRKVLPGHVPNAQQGIVLCQLF